MTIKAKIIDNDLLAKISSTALEGQRLRQNYNFHQLEEKVQRMLNALQPGTYVRPHRHVRPAGVAGFEMMLAIQGAFGVLFFDENGEITEKFTFSATGDAKGIEIPIGTFHSIVALEKDTVIFELKEGPYEKLADKDFLACCPEENTTEAAALAKAWQEICAQKN